METFAFILLSIVILLLMVLIHEAGHYTTAKILGFTVDEFAVGFGPKIFSRRRKNGELFSLRALPLGGFCSFYGEAEEDDAPADKNKAEMSNGKADGKSDITAQSNADTAEPAAEKKEDLLSYAVSHSAAENARNANADISEAEKSANKATDITVSTSTVTVAAVKEENGGQTEVRLGRDGKPALTFFAQKPWKRIIVLLGGVVFNFLSAIIFSLIYIGVVGFPVPEISDVYTYEDPETHIETAYNEFEKGDRIIAVDGQEITVLRSYNDIMEDVGNKKTVKFTVLRGGKEKTVVAVRQHIIPQKEGSNPYDGFGFEKRAAYIGNNAGNAFTYCVPYTFKLSWSILGSFGDILTGKQSITNMTGPIGSVSFMAQVSAADWRNILILLPLLASNLAIFNLLPFPALDGAHVVFTAVEWVRKKPIKRKIENMIHFVGMVVLLLFVLVVDILSFAL